MVDWLGEAFPNGTDLPVESLAKRLGMAFLLGCLVAAIYRLTRRPAAAEGTSLVPTLVLLTVLMAMITLVIGDSSARAFSLVGALAIVRFRTVVEDTRDTAFVVFAVGVGMAVGAGFLRVPVLGIAVAGLAAYLFRFRPVPEVRRPAVLTLSVRIGAGHNPEALLRGPLDHHAHEWHLLALATARQGAALDATYRVQMRGDGDAAALVAEINSLEGVQTVELRQG